MLCKNLTHSFADPVVGLGIIVIPLDDIDLQIRFVFCKTTDEAVHLVDVYFGIRTAARDHDGAFVRHDHAHELPCGFSQYFFVCRHAVSAFRLLQFIVDDHQHRPLCDQPLELKQYARLARKRKGDDSRRRRLLRLRSA